MASFKEASSSGAATTATISIAELLQRDATPRGTKVQRLEATLRRLPPAARGAELAAALRAVNWAERTQLIELVTRAIVSQTEGVPAQAAALRLLHTLSGLSVASRFDPDEWRALAMRLVAVLRTADTPARIRLLTLAALRRLCARAGGIGRPTDAVRALLDELVALIVDHTVADADDHDGDDDEAGLRDDSHGRERAVALLLLADCLHANLALIEEARAHADGRALLAALLRGLDADAPAPADAEADGEGEPRALPAARGAFVGGLSCTAALALHDAVGQQVFGETNTAAIVLALLGCVVARAELDVAREGLHDDRAGAARFAVRAGVDAADEDVVCAAEDGGWVAARLLAHLLRTSEHARSALGSHPHATSLISRCASAVAAAHAAPEACAPLLAALAACASAVEVSRASLLSELCARDGETPRVDGFLCAAMGVHDAHAAPHAPEAPARHTPVPSSLLLLLHACLARSPPHSAHALAEALSRARGAAALVDALARGAGLASTRAAEAGAGGAVYADKAAPDLAAEPAAAGAAVALGGPKAAGPPLMNKCLAPAAGARAPQPRAQPDACGHGSMALGTEYAESCAATLRALALSEGGRALVGARVKPEARADALRAHALCATALADGGDAVTHVVALCLCLAAHDDARRVDQPGQPDSRGATGAHAAPAKPHERSPAARLSASASGAAAAAERGCAPASAIGPAALSAEVHAALRLLPPLLHSARSADAVAQALLWALSLLGGARAYRTAVRAESSAQLAALAAAVRAHALARHQAALETSVCAPGGGDDTAPAPAVRAAGRAARVDAGGSSAAASAKAPAAPGAAAARPAAAARAAANTPSGGAGSKGGRGAAPKPPSASSRPPAAAARKAHAEPRGSSAAAAQAATDGPRSVASPAAAASAAASATLAEVRSAYSAQISQLVARAETAEGAARRRAADVERMAAQLADARQLGARARAEADEAVAAAEAASAALADAHAARARELERASEAEAGAKALAAELAAARAATDKARAARADAERAREKADREARAAAAEAKAEAGHAAQLESTVGRLRAERDAAVDAAQRATRAAADARRGAHEVDARARADASRLREAAEGAAARAKQESARANARTAERDAARRTARTLGADAAALAAALRDGDLELRAAVDAGAGALERASAAEAASARSRAEAASTQAALERARALAERRGQALAEREEARRRREAGLSTLLTSMSAQLAYDSAVAGEQEEEGEGEDDGATADSSSSCRAAHVPEAEARARPDKLVAAAMREAARRVEAAQPASSAAGADTGGEAVSSRPPRFTVSAAALDNPRASATDDAAPVARGWREDGNTAEAAHGAACTGSGARASPPAARARCSSSSVAHVDSDPSEGEASVHVPPSEGVGRAGEHVAPEADAAAQALGERLRALAHGPPPPQLFAPFAHSFDQEERARPGSLVDGASDSEADDASPTRSPMQAAPQPYLAPRVNLVDVGARNAPSGVPSQPRRSAAKGHTAAAAAALKGGNALASVVSGPPHASGGGAHYQRRRAAVTTSSAVTSARGATRGQSQGQQR